MTQEHQVKSLPSNIRWGTVWALGVATGFSAWVLLMALARRSWLFRFDELEMSASQIIASYYGTAVIAGPVVGLLRPLTRWRIGTFILGTVVGTLVYGTIGFTMYGWTEVMWITPLLGLATGGLALVIQDQDRGCSAANPRRVRILVAVAVALLLVLWVMYWA